MPELHHPLGGTSLSRRELCPLSLRLEEEAYRQQQEKKVLGEAECEDGPSDDAKEGTLLHSIIADPSTDRKNLTIEQRNVLSDAEAMMDSIIGNEEGIVNRFTEKTLILYDDNFDELTFSTIDRIYIYRGNAVVVDWKFGRTKVDPPQYNWQSKLYSLLTARNFGLNSITFHYIQPRIRSNQFYTFSPTELDKIFKDFMVIKMMCEMPDAKAVPGFAQCQYCKAKKICDAFIAHNEAVTNFPREEAISKRISMLDDNNLGELSSLSGLVYSEAKKEMMRRARLNGECCGKGFSTRSGKKVAVSVESIYEKMVPQYMTNQQFMENVQLSVSSLQEKFVEVNAERTEKGRMRNGEKKRLEDILSPILTGLVTESDPTEVFETLAPARTAKQKQNTMSVLNAGEEDTK